MLYQEVLNEYGELTYIPTTAGNVLLGAIILILLVLAVAFVPREAKQLSVRQLAFCAIAVCLGYVLSNIKIFRFPTGGAITLLSMLAVSLPGYWFGLHAGILAGVAHGLLSMLVDPYILFPLQLFVDYILAFGALGLSGLFSNKKNGLAKGYIAAVCGRYVFAVLSGWLFFGSYAWEGWGALPYSLVYNLIYILPEAIITLVIINLPPVKKLMETLKRSAIGGSGGV